VLIYISSSNNPDDLIQAKSINEITDYLVKPLNRDEYTSILNSFFNPTKSSGFIKAKLP
jgi:hypothetical protein